MRATMIAQLVTEALVMAIWRPRYAPHPAASFRSREQYTIAPFQRLLADHGVTCSMRRGATSGTMR